MNAADYNAAGVVAPAGNAAQVSIKDMFAQKGNAVASTCHPSVPLTGCRFYLLDMEPMRLWENNVPLDDYKMDEAGRVRCRVSFTMTDAKGISTSTTTPLTDAAHYYSADEVQTLLALRGAEVELKNPRVEFREKVKVNEKNAKWSSIESEIAFAFDGFDLGLMQ